MSFLAALRRRHHEEWSDGERDALKALARWVEREHVAPKRVATIAGDAWISPLSSIRFADRVVIGSKAALGPFVSVWGGEQSAWARIGEQVQLGPGSLIVAGNHRIDGPGPVRELGFDERDVTIDDGAWVGANAVVIGCHIGAGAVVGANAVVLDDVPPGAIVIGQPARVSRYREGWVS